MQWDVPDPIEVSVYNEFYEPSIDFVAFSGWDVVAIDGQRSLDVLTKFADEEIGLLKDDGSRFNLAVTGFETGIYIYCHHCIVSLAPRGLHFILE